MEEPTTLAPGEVDVPLAPSSTRIGFPSESVGALKIIEIFDALFVCTSDGGDKYTLPIGGGDANAPASIVAENV